MALARLAPEAVPAPPAGARAALIVLVSAAVGFTTNWLAIKMLFRPRTHRRWLLPWRQGLLPREQARLARALGDVAERRLLSPDAISGALADTELRTALGSAIRREVEDFLAAPETREVLQRAAAEGLRTHGPDLVHRLRPRMRAGIESLLDRHLTAERVLGWMEGAAHQLARNREARRTLARWIIRETSREGSVTRIIEILKDQMHEYRRRHPVRGFLAEQFVVDWDSLRETFVDTLRSESATEDLAEVLVESAHSIAERLAQPGAAESITAVRHRLLEMALDWFEHEGVTMLADRVAELAEEPETWDVLAGALDELAQRFPEAVFERDSGELRPHVRAQVAQLQTRLVETFPVSRIVEGQVLAMDPAAVESLVDEIGRRELAWIQILGLLIGALAGAGLAMVL